MKTRSNSPSVLERFEAMGGALESQMPEDMIAQVDRVSRQRNTGRSEVIRHVRNVIPTISPEV